MTWLVWIVMFLFGVFVVFMGCMIVMAFFVRLYQAADSAAGLGRKVTAATTPTAGQREPATSCQS